MPSISLARMIWQPRRLVGWRPGAMSSISSSSSLGSGRSSKCTSETTTWQVAQATLPSHAPSRRWARYIRLSPTLPKIWCREPSRLTKLRRTISSGSLGSSISNSPWSSRGVAPNERACCASSGWRTGRSRAALPTTPSNL
eukprot:scaffold28992_cov69-Phaeocystis_antarctica.AAC.3